MKRYAIWDKNSNVITPSGTIYSADEWKAMYPVANIPGVEVICSPGVVNGGIFGILEDYVNRYTAMGVDFSSCVTSEDKLAAIESFEDAMEEEMRQKELEEQEHAEEEFQRSMINNQRIADALEDLVVLSMPDVE